MAWRELGVEQAVAVHGRSFQTVSRASAIERVGLRAVGQARDDAEPGAGDAAADDAEAHGVDDVAAFGERDGEAGIEGVARAGRVDDLDRHGRHHDVELVGQDQRAGAAERDHDIAHAAAAQLAGELARGARIVGGQAEQDAQLALVRA